MLVEAALSDEHGDQDGFHRSAGQASSAYALDRQSERRRAADQHDDRDGATFAARGFAANLAVEFAVEERDRTAGENDRMRNMAEDGRHIAEECIKSEAADQDQQGVDTCGRHHPVGLSRLFRRLDR